MGEISPGLNAEVGCDDLEGKENPVTERKINKLTPNKVKLGDLMGVVYFVKVESIPVPGEHIVVKDLDQDQGEINVRGSSLIKNSFSADQYEEVVKLNQTEVLEIFVTCYNRPFTVVFDKDNGEERTLRGRLISPDNLRGRSKVEDLDQPANKRIRLVDHRTVKSLVVNGVKYEVK